MPKGRTPGGLCCPGCNGYLHVSRSKRTEVDGTPAVKRYRRCWDCGLSFTTIEVILQGISLHKNIRKLRQVNQRRVAEELARLMTGGKPCLESSTST